MLFFLFTFSLVVLHSFCQLECIHILTWQCIHHKYCLYLHLQSTTMPFKLYTYSFIFFPFLHLFCNHIMCILQLMQKFHLFFYFFHVSFVQSYSNIHVSVDTACTISTVSLLLVENCQKFHIYRIYLNARQLSSKMTPSVIKRLLRKNTVQLISYTEYTKHVRFYLPLTNSVTVSVFTVNAFIFLTITTTIPIVFTVIP